MSLAISVVIPTYNRCSLLEKALVSILSGSLQKDQYEILVSDDGSTDQTEFMIKKFQATHSNLIYIKNNHTGSPAIVRNSALKRAKGNIIAFTDDDAVADPHWLEKGFNYFSNPEIAGIEGGIQSDISFPLRKSFFPVKGKRYTNMETNEKGWYGYYLINMLYRKSILDKINGLDEEFILPSCEDIDLAWRVLDFGMVKYAPEVKVYHPVRRFDSLKDKRRYHMERMTHQALLYRKHPEAFQKFYINTLPYHIFHMGYLHYFSELIKGGIRDNTLLNLSGLFIPTLRFILKQIHKQWIKLKIRVFLKK